MAAVLIVAHGLDKGLVFELREGRAYRLGRDGADLSLTDGRVARHHAQLTCRDGGWRLEDLDSPGGTRVNVSRVSEPVALHDGDYIQVGRTVLVFAGVRPNPWPQSAEGGGTGPHPKLPGANGDEPGSLPARRDRYNRSTELAPRGNLPAVIDAAPLARPVALTRRQRAVRALAATTVTFTLLMIGAVIGLLTYLQTRQQEQIDDFRRQVDDLRVTVHARQADERDLRRILIDVRQSQLAEASRRVVTPEDMQRFREEVLRAVQEKVAAEQAADSDADAQLTEVLEELRRLREERAPDPRLRGDDGVGGDGPPKTGAQASTGSPSVSEGGASVTAAADGRPGASEAGPVPMASGAPAEAAAARGEDVVFVVDESGPAADRRAIGGQLEKFIGELRAEDRCTVIYFGAEHLAEWSPAGIKPLERVRGAGREGEAPRPRPRTALGGRGEAEEAIERAMAYGPDRLVILSDRAAIAGRDPLRADRLLELLDSLNGDGSVRIDTAQFFYQDPRRLMQHIAARHGGRYRFFVEIQHPDGGGGGETVRTLYELSRP